MEHNLCKHRSGLLLSDLYSATPGFLPAVGWQADTFGKILVEKRSGAVAVAAVVGRELPTRLDCGPSGNFTGQGRGSLKTAKFQLDRGGVLLLRRSHVQETQTFASEVPCSSVCMDDSVR